MKKFLILALMALLMVGCKEKVEPVVQPGTVIPLPPIEWHVVTKEELVRIYTENGGMVVAEGMSLKGFAATQGDRVMVFTTVPVHVDDDVTLTLGHEIMHIALGEYHK